MSFQIHVAATRNDWIELFKQANGEEILRFYASEAWSMQSIIPMCLSDLPNFGMASVGILVQEPHYLAIPTTKQIVPREIRQNDGQVRYNIDERTNPDAFNFWPGGIWKNDFFVLGEMSSVHKTGVCADVAKKMRRIMRKTFEYSGIFWIGPECQRLYSNRTFTYDFRYPTAWGSLNSQNTLDRG